MPIYKHPHPTRVVIGLISLFLAARPIMAAPYFYLTGDSVGATGYDETFKLMLLSSTNVLTAAQTVITYDPVFWYKVQLSTINSLCSFWAPADPSLGFGNSSTPYFAGGNKIVVSCGFTNPGYMSVDADGDSLLSLTLKPLASGSSTLSFSNTQFRYIGTTVAPGTSVNYDFDIYGSTFEAELARPTPRPSTVSATPVPSSTPIPSPDTLKASDLVLVEIGAGSGSAQQQVTSAGTSNLNQELDLVEEDNAIPPPPADLELRPRATPYIFNKNATQSAQNDEGEVLSLQSLRELLIPGKSSADKNLVLFNLVTTLSFITLLAILVWRMLISSRTNQLKYRHMNELLEGELSVIESKIEGIRLGTGTETGVEKTLEDLKKELDQSK